MSPFLDALGFKNLDPETATRLEEIAAETVMNRVFTRLDEAMLPENVEKARHIWQTGTDTEFFDYLTSSGVNPAQLIGEETNSFIEQLTQSGKIIRGEHG
jgi:hypothetical protein